MAALFRTNRRKTAALSAKDAETQARAAARLSTQYAPMFTQAFRSARIDSRRLGAAASARLRALGTAQLRRDELGAIRWRLERVTGLPVVGRLGTCFQPPYAAAVTRSERSNVSISSAPRAWLTTGNMHISPQH